MKAKQVLSDRNVIISLVVTIIGILSCAIGSSLELAQNVKVIIGFASSLITIIGGALFTKAYVSLQMDEKEKNKKEIVHHKNRK